MQSNLQTVKKRALVVNLCASVMAFGWILKVTETTYNCVKPSMWLILVLMFFLDYYLEACQGCNLVCSKITTRMEEMDHWENGCNIQWLTVDSMLIFCRWDEGKKERVACSGSEAEEKETRLNENEKKNSEEILKCSQSTRGRIISFDLHTKNSRRRGNAEQVYHSAESAQIKGLLVTLCYKTTVLHLGWSCPWT